MPNYCKFDTSYCKIDTNIIFYCKIDIIVKNRDCTDCLENDPVKIGGYQVTACTLMRSSIKTWDH